MAPLSDSRSWSVARVRVVSCVLYAPSGERVARVDRPAPAPDKLEHGGTFYRRAHRLPSGWAYERMVGV